MDSTLHSNKYFSFLFDTNVYAIPLQKVIEVGELLEIYPSPWKHKAILGMINYNGLPLPVINPDELSGINRENDLDFELLKVNASLVILEEEGFFIAIILSRFHNIFSYSVQRRETGLDEKANFILASTMIEKNMVLCLDTKRISIFLQSLIKGQFSLQQKKERERIEKETVNKILFFSIGNINLCLPVHDVEEVLENISVAPLFKVPTLLRGLINLRGKAIACLDISSFLNLNNRNLNENTVFVLVQHETIEFAICVDSVGSMNEFDSLKFIPGDGVLSESMAKISAGVFQLEEDTCILISTENIIKLKELQIFMDH
ncbi:MAG: chemotaxis protein CheW [Leptospiraceae bacterium]|nr:chemotaxis protein CheW [Leptospiraceae bacterium]